MSHTKTIFAQILKFVPRYEFERLAKKHHSGRAFRTTSRWSQFTAMAMGQLCFRTSLRDITQNLHAKSRRLYHLGTKGISRSSLARINSDKSYKLYEELFHLIFKQCQKHAPKHDFDFEHPLYSLDSSTIDLCLSVFPWAKFRTKKGAIKLHVGLNHSGYLPEFITVTDGKVGDSTVAKTIQFPTGSFVVVDRGYNDYCWYNTLNSKEISFVTRLKDNAAFRVVDEFEVGNAHGVTKDCSIEFTGKKSQQDCPIRLRLVSYFDETKDKEYRFLTNNFSLDAATIAKLYKARWQVELFFKWIKQHLKIKTFLGTSENAVMTQIWIAMCVYLVIAFLKFISKTKRTMHQILQLLQLNLFDTEELFSLIAAKPPKPPDGGLRQREMCLA